MRELIAKGIDMLVGLESQVGLWLYQRRRDFVVGSTVVLRRGYRISPKFT